MTTEKVKSIVEHALSGEYVQTEQLFRAEMAERVEAYLEEQKELVAKDFFFEALTKGEKNKSEIIIHGMKKNEDDFKKRYGDRWKSVMYATATQMAKNENGK